MKEMFETLLNWSEVWALLIPLTVLLFHRRQPPILKPVILYIWVAFAINLTGDLNVDFKDYFPSWFQSNNPLYNIHSIVRFTCFSYFFISLKPSSFKTLKRLLPLLSLLFILINFSFFEDFFYRKNLSSNLLTVEAYLLLIYCMLYYLSQLKADVEEITGGFDFWIVTGLSIYVVINFFVFLFYSPMLKQNVELAIDIWNVHNIAYIILCLFIAKAFYATATN